jgi:hypothetical protein
MMASVRENFGYHTRLFSGPKEAVMIFSQQQALLKAPVDLQDLVTFTRRATDNGMGIDRAERELNRRLLTLGLTLQLFILEHGDGDLGEDLPAEDGRTLRRLPEPHDCRYVSIFGELNITCTVYGSREGQENEGAPLDDRLGLDAGDSSYVMEDWSQRFRLKGSFASKAAESLDTILGLRLGSRTLEYMSQGLAGFELPFRDAVEPPLAAEDGPRLVVTPDGEGVPMRRPFLDGPRRHHRRTKGEKANKKQMACVGAVYSIEPFVRSGDDILDEVFCNRLRDERPEPAHKHVWAEMSRDFEGEPLSAKDADFDTQFDDLNRRNAGHDRPVVCLMDGERALREAQRVDFPEAVGVLDMFHVLERLWTAAHCFHREGNDEVERFVEDRLRGLLEGRVGYAIVGLRQRLTEHGLTG